MQDGQPLVHSQDEIARAVAPSQEPYAVAFGQYGNKNVDMVIDAWAILRDRGTAMPIKLIGMPDSARSAAEAHIARLGLTELVTLSGWLFGDDLRQCFGGAGVFVFPSEFEGFGIPAVEVMRLRIPLVISPEAALSSSRIAVIGHIAPEDRPSLLAGLNGHIVIDLAGMDTLRTIPGIEYEGLCW